jgi:ribosomal protein S12 methylthiotransferase
MAKVGLISLGCPKNVVDAEEILGELKRQGHQFETDPACAEVLIVNTCGFIKSAKEESIDAVLDAVRYKTNGACRSVIVTGCLAQRYGEELAEEIPEADAVLGLGRAAGLPDVLARTLLGERVVDVAHPGPWWKEPRSRVLSTAPWTAYLRLSDGCDNRCTYCAIPIIRGGFASRPEEHILAEAKALAQGGVKELCLVAQDVTRYGLDTEGRLTLPALLGKLSDIEGIRWIRLLYAYPSRVSEELINTVARNKKVLAYYDIPLQHASARVLASMNRAGSGKEYLDLIKRIRAATPDAVLRTTFMVGFPGETEEDFEELLDFVRLARFDRMGAFIYSPEDGTPASEFGGRVKGNVSKARYKRIMSLQQEISFEINRGLVGRELDVLIEHVNGSTAVGRTMRDAPEIDGAIKVEGIGAKVVPGSFIRAEIVDAGLYDVQARFTASNG